MALFFALLLIGTPLVIAVMDLMRMRKAAPTSTKRL